jgi:hypothetical protein
MRNCGMAHKREESGWELSTALQKLSNAVKQDIARTLTARRGSKLVYINQMWVVEQLDFYKKEGKEIAVGGKLDAASVVTATGAYSFTEAQERQTSFPKRAINFVGEEILVSFVSREMHSLPVDRVPEQSFGQLLGRESSIVFTETGRMTWVPSIKGAE